MADLSKVLQALGAILQGGGGTLTAIDEDKRKKERERIINEQIAAQTAAMKESAGDREFDRTMRGQQRVPEGGLPIRPDFSVPNPMGGASLPMTDPSQETRVQGGGFFRDTAQPSPNEQAESQATLRELTRLTEAFLPELEQMPEFQGLAPDQQESARSLLRSGHLSPGAIIARVEGKSREQAAQELQRAHWESGANIARRFHLPWDIEYIPGEDYKSKNDAMFGIQASASIGRQYGGGGGAGDGALSHTRISDSAYGDAGDLVLQGKSITEVTDALIPDYPNLTRGELRKVAQKAYEDVRKGGGNSLFSLQDKSRPVDVQGVLNRMGIGGLTGGQSGGGRSEVERLLGGGR